MAGRASFSSSSSFGWKYDVFLSFRGPDTRFGFTGNLYKALHDKGIHTFFDDDELQRGDEITPSLLNAIEESRIAIPIFSQNYASSSFCLDELVNIIDCVKAKGRLVFPVFYDVDPSHVRHQRGSYGEALAKHVERFFKYDKEKLNDNMERLNNWKMALKQAANLSGEHFKLGNEKYEHEFIGKIVKVVSGKINRALLHVADYPVGLESRVLKVKSLLDVRSDDVVHMVGIHGMGGIGKTTLARAVYNLIADQFEGLCFLDDVRENSIKHGIVHLQKTLLSKIVGIVGEKNNELGSVNEGIPIIKHRLHMKKVLLILDDVDKLEQLRAIVGGLDWFGSGSRVIITTRDKHLLASHGVERKYELEVLNEKEALELLSWNAFKYDKVDPSYMDILNQAVTYASGLPLVLEVIGSNLFGKRLEEWESALDRYERIPSKKIQKILKVSFDALEEDEQKIFLDIACCFKGYGLAVVEDILHAHYGVCKKYGIGVLVDKSFIKIRCYCVTLHDLIQDMGREIVRQESPEKPGKRSRLWRLEDIVQVLEDNTGTSEIEILNMDFLKFEEEVNWDGEAFKKMENLKTLIIRNGHFSEAPKHLPNSLRVLKWWEYPSESLPSDFHPKKLVILEMSNSCLRSLGLLEMWKKFVNLRVLNFDNCECITEIPNVSGVPNLEKIQFSYCENLIKIHESIGFLDKLRILNVEGCCMLRSFPPIKLTSLEELRLSKCSSLESFPEILGKMENITELYVVETPIKKLPFSIQNLTGLRRFTLQKIQMLQLSRSIVMLPKLDELTLLDCDVLGSSKQDEGEEQVSLMVSSNAESLNLTGCNLSDEFIPIILAWFSNVKHLDLSENNFTILPTCIKECHFLRELNLDSCKLLREIRGIPPNIEILHATNCTSLTSSCRSMLLNKELHEEGGDKMFCLEGTKIPEWFEDRSREMPISFWFCNKFPAISLCFVVELVDKIILKDMVFPPIWLKLIVNGSKVLSKGQSYIWNFRVADRIYIFDRKQIKFEYDVDEVLIENEWNHVVFTLEMDKCMVIKQSGIHVFKQRSSMEDIRFTDPLLLKEEHRSDTGDSQRQFMQQLKNLALLEQHVGQGREWRPWLPPPALKSLNDNVNWDSNLMVSTQISSTPSVQGCEESHIITLDKETNELCSSPEAISDSDSIMPSCNSDIDGGNGGLREQRHLTSMDQQNFEGDESVNKAKGKGMVSLAVACNSNAGEDNGISPLMEQLSMTKVASEKYQHPSYDKAMAWDPMELEYQVTYPEDQIVSNDESTLSDEGCHVMESDQRTGKWQFCLCILFSSLLSLCSSSSSLDAA